MTQPITRWKAGEEMRKRNHVIPVRLNAKELRFLEEQVEKSGLSREEYIRSIVMGGEVRARPCEHHAELLRKISGLCNNANQLAHVANGCGCSNDLFLHIGLTPFPVPGTAPSGRS